MAHFSIVITTINVPTIIEDIRRNVSKFNHKDIVDVIIIGDMKTPHLKVKQLINNMKGNEITVDYFDIERQQKWLNEFPKLANMVPYNSDNRRNLGYLISAENNADVIISMDDDNFPVISSDLIGGHSVVSNTVELPSMESENGWFNICSLLKNNLNMEIYPRGFPYSERFKGNNISIKNKKAKIAINLGLWNNTPDIDAITHLSMPVKIIGFKEMQKVILPKGVWSPINSQNTAVSKRALPSYYFLSMECKINGLKLDRYGDIWQGYFAKKIIDDLGEGVSVGTPVVSHDRNMHDYLTDLKAEFWGVLLTERIVTWLRQVDIDKSSYIGAYFDLAEKISKDKNIISGELKEVNDYLEKLSGYMQIWANVCEKLL